MERKRLLIKKYENRRLYDTTNSRYVNLDEVARAVQDGVDVQVVDATTGEDLTRLVLTQIVVESAKGPDSVFPLDILRQMVVATGRASRESTLKYMQAMMDMYQSALRPLPQTLNPFDFVMGRPSPPPPPPPPEDFASAAPPPEHEPRKSQEQAFEQRITELEGMVSKLAAKRSPAKPKPKAKTKPKARGRK
jgi:polyhydroxyalkanoate synthesis repressor PhaR